MTTLSADGWQCFDASARTRDWAAAAYPKARAAVSASENAHWLRCGGTWFAGVDALPNANDGSIGGTPLAGPALDHLSSLRLLPARWHKAQLSVVYPGYPKPWAGESDAAFRFRRNRDAAHVDGLLPVGPERARMLREPHAFVLGLPITTSDGGAAPLVVWRGSHRIIGSAFRAAFADHPPEDWPNIDLTELYQSTRRRIFDTCERCPVHVPVGGAYLVHRMALHGVAPWAEGATSAPAGRMIAYFRPEMHIEQWISED